MGWVSLVEDAEERLAELRSTAEQPASAWVARDRLPMFITAAERLLAELRALIELATDPAADLAGEVSGLREDNEVLSLSVDRLTIAQSRIADLEKKLAHAAAEPDRLRGRLAKAYETNRRAHQERDALEAKYKEQLNTVQARLEVIERHLGEVTADRDRLRVFLATHVPDDPYANYSAEHLQPSKARKRSSGKAGA